MDLIVELRKLEGINTSFDYGVEIIVMTIKETIGDWETLKNAICKKETEFTVLFDFDRVCKNGFKVAKKFVFDYIKWHLEYLDFIREFRYDSYVYCSIDNNTLTLFAGGMGEIWKKEQVEELSKMLKNAGFEFICKNTRYNGDVEFRVIGRV